MVYIVREAPVTQFVIFIRIEYFSEHLLDYLLNNRITDKMKHGRVQNSHKTPTSNGILGFKCDIETLSSVLKYDFIG